MGIFDGFAELFHAKKASLQAYESDSVTSEKTDSSKFVFEQLEPRVMLDADLAALNALSSTTYLENLDYYLEHNVFTQELILVNDSLAGEQRVKDFVSDIGTSLYSFNLTDGELTIQGFKDEINAINTVRNAALGKNYEVQIAVSGDEYSDALLFQLDFSFTYSTKFDAAFDINDDRFKLITMISNYNDGRSVEDMVDVDITMTLSYAFSIEQVISQDTPDKFYVDQADAGGPDNIAGQYTINDKNGNILFKQKVDVDNSLVTDLNGNAIYTDLAGNGEYVIDSTSYLKNTSTNKYLAIDADCNVTEVATLAEATAYSKYDTLFSILPKTADANGVGGAFSLEYTAVLNDDFSAIGQIGGMTALIYEKDNVSFAGEVGTDNDLTIDGKAVNTVEELYDLIKNHNPDNKSDSELVSDFFADDDVGSESHADGNIVTSVQAAGLEKYSVTYDSENKSFTEATAVSNEEFKEIAYTELYNEDVDIYLYAKMALIPELDEWAPELGLAANWLTDALSDFSFFPELQIETAIFLYAGETAADLAVIKDKTFEASDTLSYEDAGSFQGFEVLFSPTLLDAGMFWGNMVDSFVDQIGTLFDPIMPAVELLLGEMPGLSDLTKLAGMGSLSTMDFLQAIASIYALKDNSKAYGALVVAESALEFIYLLNTGSMPEDQNLENVGDLNIGVYSYKKKLKETSFDINNDKPGTPTTALSAAREEGKKKSSSSVTSASASFDYDFATPLFTSTDEYIMGLFAGDTSATLFSLDLELEVGVEVEVTIPILSVGVADLSLIIKPSFKVEFNVGAGFDLYGMNNFLRMLDWNTVEGDNLTSLRNSVLDNAGDILLDGFYFDDHYDEAEDEDGKEFVVSLGIELGLSVGIPDLGPITVRAGVLGGLTLAFGVDLNDMPNKLPYYQWRDPNLEAGTLYKYDTDQENWDYDYHVHLDELAEMGRVKNMFELSVNATFSATIFVDIGMDLGIFSFTVIDWSMTLFEVTIFEASLSSPDSAYNIIAGTNYQEPVLAGMQEGSDGVLELYVGEKASNRRYSNKEGTGSESITDEKYIITVLGFTQADGTYGDVDAGKGETVSISFNGGTQEVAGVKKIVADCGGGDDKIQVRGKGNHVAQLGVELAGGGEDDILSYTGMGAARILGNDGQDTLIGGDGDDAIYGGKGNDRIYGRKGADTIFGEEGYDQIEGGEGADILDGGYGGYELVVDTEDSDNDDDTTDLVNGEYKGDEYYWSYGDGSDIINDTGSDDGANKDYDKVTIAGSTQRSGRNTIQKPEDVEVKASNGNLVVGLTPTWDAPNASTQTLTMDGIEEVLLGVNGGGDTIDVYDYSGTDLELLALGLDYDSYSLGGAVLNVIGTEADDTINAYTQREGSGDSAVDVVKVDRTWAPNDKYIIGVTKSDVATDYLNIYAEGGNDTITITSDGNTKVSDHLAVGKVDGGAGNDTITVENVIGKSGEDFMVSGGDGSDTLTVKNSSGFEVRGEDENETTSSDDIITIENSSDFVVNSGGGTNTLTVTDSSDFELTGGAGTDNLTLDDVADFTVDLLAGSTLLILNDSVKDGKITTGSGKTTLKNVNADGGVDDTDKLLRLEINIGGGADMDEIDIKQAEAVVLSTSATADKITLGISSDVTIDDAGGANEVNISKSSDIEVELGAGNDTVTLSNLETNSNVVVHAGAGADNITATGATGFEIYGEEGGDTITAGYGEAVIDVGSDSGIDTLNITDSNNGDNLSATVELLLLSDVLKVTNSEFGGTLSMNLAGSIDNFNINLGGGNNSAALDNKLTVKGVALDTVITGSSGNDKLIIETLINHAISFDGNGGAADELEVKLQTGSSLQSNLDYDSTDNGQTTLTGAGSSTLKYKDVDTATLALTAAAETFTVHDINNTTSIYAGGGDDTIIVDNAAYTLNVFGGAQGDSNIAGTGDTDTLVLRLSDAVALTGNTFSNIGLTTEIVEIRNSSSAGQNFVVSDQVIYADTAKTKELLNISAALGAGMLEQIVLTGNNSDTLTIDDATVSEALGVELDGNTITYGMGYSIVLKADTMLSHTGADTNIYNGFSLEIAGETYFYYQSAADDNPIWSYTMVTSSGGYNNGSQNLLVDSQVISYKAVDTSTQSLTLYDRDMDGYFEIDSKETMYALLRCKTAAAMALKYELTTDVDLSSYVGKLSAIGSECSTSFTGEFKGNGHTISGFKLTSASADGGLFAELNGAAVVENLELAGFEITLTGTDKAAGAVAARITGGTVTIKNITISGDTEILSAAGTAAGIVGSIELLTSNCTVNIQDCEVVRADIYGSKSAGIVGVVTAKKASRVTITHCKVEGLKYTATNQTRGGIVDVFTLGVGNSSFASEMGYLTIDQCLIKDSEVLAGGWYAADVLSGVMQFINSTVEGSSNVSPYSASLEEGGVFNSMFIVSGSFIISNCNIKSYVVEYGLGKRITTGSSARVTIQKCSVDATNNSTIKAGLCEFIDTDSGFFAVKVNSIKVMFGTNSTAPSVSGLFGSVTAVVLTSLYNRRIFEISDIYIDGDLSGDFSTSIGRGGKGLITDLTVQGYVTVNLNNIEVDCSGMNESVTFGLIHRLSYASGDAIVNLTNAYVHGTIGYCGGIGKLVEPSGPCSYARLNVDNVKIEISGASGSDGTSDAFGELYGFSSSITTNANSLAFSAVTTNITTTKSKVNVVGFVGDMKLDHITSECTITLCDFYVNDSISKGDYSAVVGGDWSVKRGARIYFHSSYISGISAYALTKSLVVYDFIDANRKPSFIFFYNSVVDVTTRTQYDGSNPGVYACNTLSSSATHVGLAFTHLDYKLHWADGVLIDRPYWTKVHADSPNVSGTIVTINDDAQGGDIGLRNLYCRGSAHTTNGTSYNLPQINTYITNGNYSNNGILHENDSGFFDYLTYYDIDNGDGTYRILTRSDCGAESTTTKTLSKNKVVQSTQTSTAFKNLSTVGYDETVLSIVFGNYAVAEDPGMSGSLRLVTAATTTANITYVYGMTSTGKGIIWYKRNSSDGLLDKDSMSSLTLEAGYTLKTLEVDGSGKYLLASAEYNGATRVFAYSISQTDGSLTRIDGGSVDGAVSASVNNGGVTYMATTTGGIYKVSGNATAWSVSTDLAVSSAAELGRVNSLKLSADNNYLYAVYSDADTVCVYKIESDGTLTIKSTLREGMNKARGLDGVTDVVEKGDYLIACGSTNDTLAVFEYNADRTSFEFVQRLRNGSGISNMDNPVALEATATGVRVFCQGATQATVVELVVDLNPAEPEELWNLAYSGLDKISLSMGAGDNDIILNDVAVDNIEITTLGGSDYITIESALSRNNYTVNTGAGNDWIGIMNAQSEADLNINTGAGNDTVNAVMLGGVSNIITGSGDDSVLINNVLGGSTITVSTGTGNDTINIDKVFAGSDSNNKTKLTVDAGEGNDSIEVKVIEANTEVKLMGNSGDDTISLYAGGIAQNALVSVYGNTMADSNNNLGDDTLEYYGTPSNAPGLPAGTIAAFSDSSVLTYNAIDHIELSGAALLASLEILEIGGITEGGSFTLSGANSSIPDGATAKYEWDLNNDGIYDNIASTDDEWTVDWATLVSLGIVDNGLYTIKMRVTANGYSSVASANLKIQNKKRKLQASGAASVVEDTEYTLTLDKNSISEPGADTLTKWVVDWGDGSVITYAIDPNEVGDISYLKHIYEIVGNYTITVQAYDEDGAAEAATKTLTVTADPSEHIKVVNSTNERVDEGDTYTLQLVSERAQGGAGIWKVSWGDGESSVYSSLDTTEQIALTHVYMDGSAAGTDYTITVELLDSEGSFSKTHTVTVDNVAPTVTLSGAATAAEGSEYRLTIAAPTDAGADTVSKYIIDWGDGLGPKEISVSHAGQDYIAKYVYADAGSTGVVYTIKVSLVDEDGTYTDVATKSVTVTNVAPVITFDQAGDSTTVAEGSIVRITGFSSADPGADTITDWIVDWGDGNVESYTAAYINSLTTGLEHYYADAGSYSVTVAGWDEDYTEATALESAAYTVTVTRVADDTTSSTEEEVEDPLWDEPELALADAVDSVVEDGNYALTLSNYSYDLPSDITIDEILINWGDGNVETLTSTQFMSLKNNESVVLYHKYADDGNMNISVVFKDKEVAKGALNSTTVIEAGDPETASGLVLHNGDPYYNGDRMVTNFGVIFSPGMITRDVAGVETQFYQEIVLENGVYKVKEYSVVETETAYNNSATLTVAVTDVPPEFSLSGKSSVMQGSEYSLKLSEVIDVSGDELTQYVVDWGDGSSTVVNSASITSGAVGDGRTLTHIYSAEGAKQITITSAVSDGITFTSSLANTLSINVEDAPMSIVVSGESKVYELCDYTLTLGTITDPADLSRTVVPEKWIVNWGDGTTKEIVNSANATTKELTHAYAGSLGFVYGVTVEFVVDGNTYTSSKVLNVTVKNAPPVVTQTAVVSTINEGSKFTADYTFEDSGMDTYWTVKVDYGDGSGSKEFPITEKSFSLEHTYADDGSYEVVVSVVDERGAESESLTTTVTVSNVAPTATLSGAATVAEGSEYTLTVGEAVDPGADTVSSYTVDWGDGLTTIKTADELSALGWKLTHTYADNATTREIKLSLVDEDGTFSEVATKEITVSNVAPTATLTGADTIAEGSEYTLTVGEAVDPGADTVSSYTVDWGDGLTTIKTADELSALGWKLTHTYADNAATREIKLSLVDEDGTFSEVATKEITVSNVAPTSTLSGAATVAEGSEYTLTVGEAVDPGADTVSSYTVDWGDGLTTIKTADELSALGWKLTHTYADNATTREIKLSLVDEDGTFSEVATKEITVSNVAPTATLTGAATIAEGSEYTLTVGEAVDPGADTVNSYTVDWGDGETTIKTAEELSALGWKLTHTYADNAATREIKLSLVDEDGTFSEVATKEITVSNVAPTSTLSGAATVAEGSEYTLTVGEAVDPGADTVSSYTVDWGDGLTTIKTAEELSALGWKLTHTYADNAARTIKLSLVDEDGTFSEVATKEIIVSNVAPTATLSGAATVAEGSEYTLTVGEAVDPGADTVESYTVNWGDGLTTIKTAEELSALGWKLTHTYADNATTREIKLNLVDEDGTFSEVATKEITVSNVAPTATLSGIDSTE